MADNAERAAQEAEVRETVGTFFRLVGEGDADRVADVFAEEIDWFVPGDEKVLPWAGQRTRREQVPDYFRTLWPVFVHDESEVSVDKMLVDGPDLVAVGKSSHTVAANGRRLTTLMAFRFTVEAGRIVRFHLFEDTDLVVRTVTAPN
ncbi:nuclear transport factor 2 family protein [Streptomyces sp. NBC_01190]|uniref:nuclear transport factor 2 family protein n=1 Tax=Streptomyces sp. NBC_01190 TaxID=2903767 RepID=UPI003868F31E|nr:nuclear transport factor 2 family protein [Streptomyces sp. NBC_01190]